jgi:hypothetical protein
LKFSDFSGISDGIAMILFGKWLLLSIGMSHLSFESDGKCEVVLVPHQLSIIP